MSKENKFYITTPIYYASGKPHLGHAYTSVSCDVLARWNRIIGKEVFFLTGTDEHGQKVEKNAKENKQSPKAFVDSLIPSFKEQLEKLNISNDFFIRTTEQFHKDFVQEVLQKAYDNGDIYKAAYEGLYCVDCEQYYKNDELEEGEICPIHKKKVDLLEEENYFFKLSAYQDKLLKLYKENPNFLSPNSKASETINRVKDGLNDISISRHKDSLTWGIPLPFDSDHVTYVWFDALFNYISALEENNNLDFWPADVHVVGKDIMWFHKVYWPAFLLSTGYEIPKKVFAHGWWTVDNKKMGKSQGNAIDPIEIANEYGADEFRYFMLTSASFGEDQNFTQELFANKVNNDLNNDLGNLVSRVHAMTNKYFPKGVPKINELTKDDKELLDKLNIYEKFNELIQNLDYFSAFDLLWSCIRDTNAYINKVSPWSEKNEKRLATIMNVLCSTCVYLGKYLQCIMPTKADLIFKQFNYENNNVFTVEFIKENHKFGKKENLFQKIKLDEKKEDNKVENKNLEEKREGFSKLNLIVGKILEIEQHPEADKLYIEKIDIGEKEPRQIISGLKDYYKKEELLNKKVIVVANLKPAKFRGVKSEGMILAAENKEGEVGVITTDAKVGTNLECNKEIANNTSRIQIDDFFEIKLKSDGNKITYNNKLVTAKGKHLTPDKEISGSIR